MFLAINGLLVAQYGDACTLKTASEEGEARQSKVAKGPFYVQVGLDEEKKTEDRRDIQQPEVAIEDSEELAELGEEEEKGETQQSEVTVEEIEELAKLEEVKQECTDGLGKEANHLEEGHITYDVLPGEIGNAASSEKDLTLRKEGKLRLEQKKAAMKRLNVRTLKPSIRIYSINHILHAQREYCKRKA